MSESPVKAAETSASPKSSPSKKEIDTATQALNHFAQGKRHLVVGDISSAVNSLQEACRLLAEQYGETAPECGDAYFYYGRALLEMARMENGVLGNALDGVPDGEDMDNSQVESPEKMTEEGSTEGEEEEEGDGDGDGDGDGEGEGEESQEESQDEGEKEEGASQEEGEKTEEDEEEVSNLQLSWEMLELAKVIYQKQQDDNPEMAKKVAQVYLKLGEVGLESENYSQGIEDFKQCLQIQEKILEEDNRCLAETHYQLGVAHSFSDDFDKAIDSFTAAMKVIEMRIANLEKRIKEKKEWTEEQRKKDAAERPDPFYTEEGEIEELNKLLPEMKEKVTDMEEMKKDSKDRLQKAAKLPLEPVEAFMANAIGGTSKAGSSSQTGFDAPSSSTSSTPTEIKASNITHLVRKKQRKPEDEVEGEEVKKAKGENGEPHGTANGTTNGTNGHSETMETEEKDTPTNGASTEELKEKAAEEMKKKTDMITGKTEAAS
ncbi:nuclear autoantigenic sperm protein-like isoform X5 [Penaeus monodon]|uniref:nuclear autoantigenic sperm protein-like isoform X5 n=1 Tax=Penaeus monodon TaxID=6687 RepID=UPI0018A71FE6|nr:nuclear autoantigenic sperm protein-like isoform X5 [Penaeus monodon]